MGRLIVFSGVDGAGKSTQIYRLKERLTANGHSTDVFWARGGYTPLFSFLKTSIRRLRPRSLPPPGVSVARSAKFESAKIRRLWLTLALLDLLLCYGMWLRWRKWMADFVLCDRYVDDTLLDFRRNFPAENVDAWLLWRLLRRLAPIADAAFLLIVPVEESQRRSQLKCEPFPDSPETLSWRLDKYRRLAETGEWIVLDCVQAPGEIQEKIWENIGI